MKNSDNEKLKLNIAGQLARIFLYSKLTLLIIIIAIVFGIAAILFTPRTYNPEIVVPVVNISISRPGSNAQEMLHQVVRPLEGLMSAIPGVDHTYGMAVDDSAMVTVRFKVNQNEEDSLVKVYNQINSNMNHIPPGTLPPFIQSVSLYDVPILTVTLSSSKYTSLQLQKTATQLLEQLRSVPGVGKSWVAGSSPAAVRVWLDPKKMSANYITLENITHALSINNVGQNTGKLKTEKRDIPLRVRAQLINPADVGNIVVGIYNGKPVLLSDIARVEIAPANENIQSYFSFGEASKTNHTVGVLQPAVTIALARQKGTNGVEVADDVLKKLANIEKTGLSKDITVTVTRNYGEDANDAVNTLIQHLGIAILSVVIILLLFLGWREASIVMLSIPLILFLVLGVGWIAGQTINRITLFALILSLGLLVDDSIVVIENIHRHMHYQSWRDFGDMILRAANEIGKPTIIATFTVILALIPMAFVTGMMGPFMGPIPFNAPLAMLISLIIAYTVVPYLSYLWLKTKAVKIAEHNLITTQDVKPVKHISILHRGYIYLFQPLIHSARKRRIFYIIVCLLLMVVMLQPLWQFIRPSGTNGPLSAMGVGLKMLPDDNVNTLLLEINTMTGSSEQETDRVAKAIAGVLNQNKYVTNYQLFLGESAPVDFAAMVRGNALQHGTDYAQIRINLIDKHKRSIGSHEIAQQLYASLAKVQTEFPTARIKLFETPPGPPVRSQMEGALYGPNYFLLQSLADDITKNIYPKTYGMINIDNSVTQNLPSYQVVIDKQKAVFSGLSSETIIQEINTYFSGLSLGIVHSQGSRDPENIILRFPDLSRNNMASLEKLYFLNRQNEFVPLQKMAHFEYINKNKPIYTRDQHKVVYVYGEMLHSSPVYSVATITKQLHQLVLPNGSHLGVDNLGFSEAQPNDITHYQFSWLGEMRLTLDVFRDLGAAFIVALILIYLLLTGAYQSFVIPLIIMGAIPLTMAGVFPGHWIMHQPFTATSMIGVIALAGIVVRNSLLLIDFILEKQRQGIRIESAVMDAAVVRLTPILLTALAIIFGSSVMIDDPVFGGLAISLIFGSIASTTLTLFVIPLIYLSWIKWIEK